MGVFSNSPRKSTKKKKSTTLQYLFDLDSDPKSNNGVVVVQSETEEILSAIAICTRVFTFTDPSESPRQKDLKRLKLLRLLSYVKSLENCSMDPRILPGLMLMLSVNLFDRPLPPPSTTVAMSDSLDDEELFTLPGPTWPHIQIVYDIFFQVVMAIEPEVLRGYIDHHFLRDLLSLFEYGDQRERDRWKNVYHSIYSQFTFYRSVMRRTMTEVLLSYAFATDSYCKDYLHWGIGELLEIWASIINGFTVPLKAEHKNFLKRVLIPLHRRSGMQGYYRQLGYCVSQFVRKEPALGGVVVRGILKFWPVTDCRKEFLLIGELEELVEVMDSDQRKELALSICKQLTRCMNSCNSQVAERAIYTWNNEPFVKMVLSSMEEIFPVIVTGIENNLKSHWSKSVKQLTENVKKMFREMDPYLYDRCLNDIDVRDSNARKEEMKRNELWRRIEIVAEKNDRFLQQRSLHCECGSSH